ncbi:hypothetical protein [Brevibacillus agri]|uniref:hypothetical protein n=1 Tax=Brevibacillus agri TaxID=51101 RepID=UPI0018CD0567|nr:hypothetical protein [Brevibacillus agri]MBG9568420.1 hypothetical protein [Brevibacillus agri]
MTPQYEKIRIPRKVEAKFQIFGLGLKEMFCMLPLLGIAIGTFQFFTFTWAVFSSIFIVGIPYALLSQSKYGRSGVQYVADMIKYYTKVQKRYDWSWSDEDIITQAIRIEKDEAK